MVATFLVKTSKMTISLKVVEENTIFELHSQANLFLDSVNKVLLSLLAVYQASNMFRIPIAGLTLKIEWTTPKKLVSMKGF